MALSKIKGIILNARDYGDTSKILTIYAREKGKIKAVVRGARKLTNRFGSAFQPLSYCEFTIYKRHNSDFATVTSCSQIESFNSLASDLKLLAYGTCLLELTDSLTSYEEEDRKAFNALLGNLFLLSNSDDPESVFFISQIRLLTEFGFRPHLEDCAGCNTEPDGKIFFSSKEGGLLCGNCAKNNSYADPITGETLKFMKASRTVYSEKLAKMTADRAVKDQLYFILPKFIDYHVEKDLKSNIFIKNVNRLYAWLKNRE